MVQVGEAIVSFDVLREPFCCDLGSCKGACCIEGDAGAPVTLDEVAAIEQLLVEGRTLTPDVGGAASTSQVGEAVTAILKR